MARGKGIFQGHWASTGYSPRMASPPQGGPCRRHYGLPALVPTLSCQDTGPQQSTHTLLAMRDVGQGAEDPRRPGPTSCRLHPRAILSSPHQISNSVKTVSSLLPWGWLPDWLTSPSTSGWGQAVNRQTINPVPRSMVTMKSWKQPSNVGALMMPTLWRQKLRIREVHKFVQGPIASK